MNILYDNIIYSLQKNGGISVYWSELSKRIIDDVRFNPMFLSFEKVSLTNHSANFSIPPEIINKESYSPTLFNRIMPLSLGRFSPDNPGLFHSSYYRIPEKRNNLKSITTIHDFIHKIYYKGPRAWMLNYLKYRSMNESDAIICISENTKRDLLKFYPSFAPKDIYVIYNGVSENYHLINDEKNDVKPYVLFVGGRSGYKNFDFCINVMEDCPNYELYIVGSELSIVEKRELQKRLKGRYKLFSFIEDEELNRLYNNAHCLLYPSSYEGFGIPPIEAMKAGCPVVVLNSSSLPEVCGKAGVKIDSLDRDIFSSKIKGLNCSREEVIQLGLENATRFSWDKCYRETIEVYQSLGRS